MPSRYRQGVIPTTNLRFEQFLEIVFGSKMTKDELQREICEYVKVLETGYNQKIEAMKKDINKEKKRAKTTVGHQVNRVAERSDLEQLFVNCVEDVRKEVMKRRL